MKNKLPPLSRVALVVAALAVMAFAERALSADAPYAVANKPPAAAAASSFNGDSASASQQVPATNASSMAVGDKLLKQAAAQLDRHVSVAARLRHQATLPGKSLIYGVGSYWQQGMGEDLRVRLELQIAGQEASVLQVSDSRFLWVERRLPIGRSVTRVDLRQLRADSLLNGTQLGELQSGSANWLSAQTDLIAHSGGLPSMLFTLSESFTFLPPQPMRIASETAPGKSTTSMPYFAVVGHWRPERIARLLSADGTESAPPTDAATMTATSLPARLPEEILILFGQSDLFPYRIEYRKLETPIAANQAGAAIPYHLSTRPMVVLEFTDVRFDIPTDTGQFIYTPGDGEWVDQTTAVLERLRQARNEQVARRPAQAVR